MIRYYDELIRLEDRGGFEIIVDKTWEDISLRDCFDDTCYDIRDMEIKVDNGDLDWFMLRVRALLNGHVLATETLGGCLYEDAREVLEDGVAEDMIETAVIAAREEARRLVGSLQRVIDTAAA